MSGELRVSFGGDSRPGRKAINQDAFCACLPESRGDRLRKGAVAVVCDGVSSSEDSHIASQTVVTSFARDYMDAPPNWSVNTSIGRILKGLNSWLYQQNPALRQRQDSLMTTVTAGGHQIPDAARLPCGRFSLVPVAQRCAGASHSGPCPC